MGETREPATLWYGEVALARLLADLDTVLRGLPPGAGVRLRTNTEAAWDALPEWCEAHGWRVVHRSDDWEGVAEGAPRWRAARYLFESEKPRV